MQPKRFLTFLILPVILSANLAAHISHRHSLERGPGAEDASRLEDERSGLPWWRGNLHTHSLWSDGDDYPEMIVDWYKQNGYDFLALSDHNVLSTGQKWINPGRHRIALRGGGMEALARYRDRFGSGWVEARVVDEPFAEWLAKLPAGARPGQETVVGDTVVRLKPLSEFRTLFEEPGEFLLIQSEEISDRKTIHVNATNLLEHIAPQGGATVVETMQNNVDAVLEQRERTGQAMFPHINHPNFRWSITAEELAQVERLRFFEVFNGHPAVHNRGNGRHAGTERMWDIILTKRLAQDSLGVVYGLGTDDAHNYRGGDSGKTSQPGRSWIMVRAAYLTPEHIIDALERGDFYASTGVTLSDVRFDGQELALEIDPEEGATYVTQFIGTRRGYDPTSSPVLDDEGNPLPVTRRYSEDVGEILAEVEGLAPTYEWEGDELYVRAKVVSSLPMEDAPEPGLTQSAWVQPVLPGR